MSAIEITKESIEELVALIKAQDQEELLPVLEKLYPADIAELFDDLELDEAVYVASLLEPQKKVDVLTELEADVKLKFLDGYTNDQIANDFFAYLDSDDAADILNSMDTTQGKEILRTLEDKEHSKNISSLLKFADNEAGGLMAKELIKVKLHWTVKQCTDEIRLQAEEVNKDEGNTQGLRCVQDTTLEEETSPREYSYVQLFSTKLYFNNTSSSD